MNTKIIQRFFLGIILVTNIFMSLSQPPATLIHMSLITPISANISNKDSKLNSMEINYKQAGSLPY
jgi:hypothetical protein